MARRHPGRAFGLQLERGRVSRLVREERACRCTKGYSWTTRARACVEIKFQGPHAIDATLSP